MSADVHAVHPAGCPSCAIFAPDRACLEHTCPDCGSIVYGEVNERGELTHTCAEPLPCPDCGETPCHPQCLSGGGE